MISLRGALEIIRRCIEAAAGKAKPRSNSMSYKLWNDPNVTLQQVGIVTQDQLDKLQQLVASEVREFGHVIDRSELLFNSKHTVKDVAEMISSKATFNLLPPTP
jgi:hypothetical protein